jgi:hypothetical protein
MLCPPDQEDQQASPVRKLVCPTSARLGDVVGVSWDLGPGGEPSPGDWIGLFKQNQPSNTQYVVYKKTGTCSRLSTPPPCTSSC